MTTTDFDKAPSEAITDLSGTYSIDPSHTRLGFTARHAMVTNVKGSFGEFEGTVVIDAENPAASRADVTIQVASVSTGSVDRDNHLRSADFFDVEKHGDMTFRSLSFSGDAATGELTIKGVTREVELDVEVLGTDTDPWGGTRVGIEATTEISRKAFGVDFNVPLDGGKVLVGDKVSVVLSVQAVLQADAPSA
jgi:polyisoprenoid-binding protein YceI